ncbi:MAG: two-component sensor histidine kinase [Oscillospiraceae bacterium]|nr:two-component sensor histidine kinase [Oscillospiraceae bacterium]
MTKKIFRSIISVALIVLLSSLVIATTFLYDYFNQTQVSQLKAELSLVADTVNDVGIEYFDNFDSTVFRFTVVAADGKVLYDTEADASEMENHVDREEIKEAIEHGKGSSARNSSTLTEKTFYEAVLLDDGNVLRISVSQLTVGALILSMLPAICAIVIVAVIVALVLSHRMAKKVTEPLLNLDLEHPEDNNSYEELSPILTKIHKQHKQIKSQMETLHRKSDEFEQIISSMSEGLVLLDEHGMVLSMNTAAASIFSVKESAVGKDFLVFDRTTDMSKAVEGAFSGKHSEFKTQRNGNEYQFNINPIVSDGKTLGAVILAFDITDKAFAERNRQEFTANVTHELKTPLQSIIGSAELLENGLVKPEDTSRFVGNIRKEATRLVSLINDIIRLSQLDENHEPATETVDLMDVSKEVVEVLTVSAAKRNVTLNIEGEPQTIYGVRRYIYEIIYNLCDNAIRYNVDGGKVAISIGKENGRTAVSVSDTGIGIAPEHQSRIFERFYRVDKSHSKETGGTGLGLSIVKHAVAYHSGKVTLESELGKGTTVKVVF